MTFQELKTLAWTRIPRFEGTDELYASEDRAQSAIKQAADELERFLMRPDAEGLVSRDEVMALELVTMLAVFGRPGALAAQIVVDRYGAQESLAAPSETSRSVDQNRPQQKAAGIVHLCRLAGGLAEAECEKAGLPFLTPVSGALGSGLDVALTLMEPSVGPFRGLDRQAALECITHFRSEAGRGQWGDPRVAIWYEAWAKAIEAHFT